MLVAKLEDLRIYQLAVKLRDEVYEEIHRIPFYWKNPDVDQIKRSSGSIPSNIAEGFARRYYKKSFALFLSYAIGSIKEIPNHAFALYKSGNISLEKAEYFQRKCKDLFIRTVKFVKHQTANHSEAKNHSEPANESPQAQPIIAAE
jgi:four helix bundle protein